MMKLDEVKTEDYTYVLPEEKIAKYPLSERDTSKLLIYENKSVTESVFDEIINCFTEKHLLVFNNSKVIQARIIFWKPTGSKIELLCLSPVVPSSYELIFQVRHQCIWKCAVGNIKKWKQGILRKKFRHNDKIYSLNAELLSKENETEVQFTWDGEISFGEILNLLGNMPIPPYLKRESTLLDKKRYQTVYSKVMGSVAAPTAGLHFSEGVLQQLKQKNIQQTEISLHVGAGTFKPISEKRIINHIMHSEQIRLSMDVLSVIIKNIDTVVAVGTTSTRTLESLYWLGVKISTNHTNLNIEQWDAYTLKNIISPHKALNSVRNYMIKNEWDTIGFYSRLLIIPSYKFKIVRGLITNFHQPNSTLLLLVAAFIGEDWRQVYDYALENNFRFLSYGDSSLLWRYYF